MSCTIVESSGYEIDNATQHPLQIRCCEAIDKINILPGIYFEASQVPLESNSTSTRYSVKDRVLSYLKDIADEMFAHDLMLKQLAEELAGTGGTFDTDADSTGWVSAARLDCYLFGGN